MGLSQFKLSLAEQGLIPDKILRWGMRRLCRQRLVQERSKSQFGIGQDESLEIAVETTAIDAPLRFLEACPTKTFTPIPCNRFTF